MRWPNCLNQLLVVADVFRLPHHKESTKTSRDLLQADIRRTEFFAALLRALIARVLNRNQFSDTEPSGQLGEGLYSLAEWMAQKKSKLYSYH